jgi:tetratricopeptide (TPR) repeat protein
MWRSVASVLALTGLAIALAVVVLTGGDNSSALASNDEAEWRAFTDSGWRLCREGNPADAEEHLTRALRSADRFPANDPRRALTQAYLAQAALQQGKRDAAGQYARQSLAAYDPLPTDAANDDAGKGVNALALVYLKLSEPGRADRLFRKAIELETKVTGPRGVEVAQLLANRAAAFESQGRYEEAEPLRKQQVAMLDDAAHPRRIPLAAAAHQQLGRLYQRWHHDKQAEPHFVRAVELRRSQAKKDTRAVAAHLSDLGRYFLTAQRYPEAEVPLWEAVQIRERVAAGKQPADRVALADALHDLGALHLKRGRLDLAKPLLKRSLAIRDEIHPEGDLRAALTLHHLGTLYAAQEQYGPAQERLLRALQIKEKAIGPDSVEVAAAREDLALLYARAGEVAEAEAHFRKALAVRERVEGAEHRGVAATLHNLANLYRDHKRPADAEPLYRRSLAIKEKALGPQHRSVAVLLDNYAQLLRRTDRAAEADALATRAAAIRGK